MHPILHIALPTNDPDLSMLFYGCGLGWRRSDPWSPLAAGPLASISLTPWFLSETGRPRLYVRVENCVKAAHRFALWGGHVLTERESTGSGWRALVSDPWGHELALWQPPRGMVPTPWATTATSEASLEGVALEVPSANEAQEFYRATLGWRAPDHRNVLTGPNGLPVTFLERQGTTNTLLIAGVSDVSEILHTLVERRLTRALRVALGGGGGVESATVEAPDGHTWAMRPSDRARALRRAWRAA